MTRATGALLRPCFHCPMPLRRVCGCILCHLNWPVTAPQTAHTQACPLSWVGTGDSQDHKELAQELEPHRLEVGSQPSAPLMPQLPHLPSRDKVPLLQGLGEERGSTALWWGSAGPELPRYW